MRNYHRTKILDDPHTTSRLEAIAQEESARLTGKLTFAVRVDDIGQIDVAAERFFKAAIEARIALNLEVIPSHLNQQSASWILELSNRPGARIEIHQHGWQHTNYAQSGRKAEFCSKRAFERKRNDIVMGWSRLNRMLPDLCFPIFCPPWNRIDKATLLILEQCGFAAVSCFEKVKGLPKSLADLSATIDWSCIACHRHYDVPIGLVSVLDCLRRHQNAIIMTHPIRRTDEYWHGLIDVLKIMLSAGARSVLLSEMIKKPRQKDLRGARLAH